jgi:hypothetical protein
VVNLNTQLTGAIVTDKFFGEFSQSPPQVSGPNENKTLLNETIEKDVNLQVQTTPNI